jgi:hypothetical protein
VWIPIVTQAGWLIISKDSAIARSPRMRALIVAHEARMIAVASRARGMNTWEHLEIVVSQWRAIESLADVPGPWIYRASRTSLVKIL